MSFMTLQGPGLKSRADLLILRIFILMLQIIRLVFIELFKVVEQAGMMLGKWIQLFCRVVLLG